MGVRRVESAEGATGRAAGYHGRPVLKPPPWTWEVPAYLFLGGMAGGSAVLAFAAHVAGGQGPLVRTALWVALGGVLASAPLLVSDLGRPARFLYMLRVFKWRSPMSVGVWALTAFGGAVSAAVLLEHLLGRDVAGAQAPFTAALALAALLGSVVATYTGVLLAATAVPAWNTHRGVLPIHFGATALGSAAAALELLGHRPEALYWVGLMAAGTETLVFVWTEARRSGARDAALRTGRSGLLVRAAGLLSGPASLALRVVGWGGVAGAVFLVGAALSRFGWVAAGQVSTQDPSAAL